MPKCFAWISSLFMTDKSCMIAKLSNSHKNFHFLCFSSRVKITWSMPSINFMDLTVYKVNNRLMFNWYRKPIFSGRFLNILSQHPISYKRDVLIGLIDRVLCLSHPMFYQDNLNLVIDILMNIPYLSFLMKLEKD